MTQAVGVLAYGAFTVICASALFLGIKATMGLRVSEEEEIEGLDLGEHGMHAWDVHVGASGFPTGESSLRASSHAPSTVLAAETN